MTSKVLQPLDLLFNGIIKQNGWSVLMSALPEAQPMTEAEYLAFEREQAIKHEYIAGEVYAMTGGTENHSLISVNLILSLGSQVRNRGCKVYDSHMRIRTPQSRAYLYPDVSALCGTAQFDGQPRTTFLNPSVIIEVLSPSTQQYDRGKKFQLYRELLSLQEYVLVAQDSPHMDQFVRQANGTWVLHEAIGMEATLTLSSIACSLALADVYAQVTFEEEA